MREPPDPSESVTVVVTDLGYKNSNNVDKIGNNEDKIGCTCDRNLQTKFIFF